MEEKTDSEVTQTEAVSENKSSIESQTTQMKRWVKPLSFTLLGILVGSSLFWGGYKFAQIRRFQVIPTPTPFLTPAPTIGLSPTPVISPSPIGSPTPTPSARVIPYKDIDGWIEYDSPTGYSIQFPPAYKNLSTRMDAYGKSGCSTYANDGLGGIISCHVFPYTGGSRRELFYSAFGKEGYEYAFEEVLISGINSLVIEIGPKGDSGTGVSVVIPKGNAALVLFWGNRYRGEQWDKLLGTIEIGQKLDISKCPSSSE